MEFIWKPVSSCICTMLEPGKSLDILYDFTYPLPSMNLDVIIAVCIRNNTDVTVAIRTDQIILSVFQCNSCGFWLLWF